MTKVEKRAEKQDLRRKKIKLKVENVKKGRKSRNKEKSTVEKSEVEKVGTGRNRQPNEQ